MRDINPKTASFIPIETIIETKRDELSHWSHNLGKPITEVTIRAWDRKKDSVITYKVTITDEKQGVLIESSLDDIDKAWLKNIGARE